ncbi:hypothetical protein [Lewinella sp. W8]|uniref:hypothetical protein n=1 Tax=Lewinella sp. W8 TaxID=2528208 RepID=UPI001067D88D|nr:hypothetical protein [Lewinella sp. W8]MTB52077.1 hypothetical protein [Lewinella sp. W8]
MVSVSRMLVFVGLMSYVLFQLSCAAVPKHHPNSLPTFLLGEFEDDYGISYQIDQKEIRLLPNDRFHLLNVNVAEGYLILQNDSLNTFAPALFTRIDYQKLDGMAPYEWALCFSSYDEISVENAIDSVNTDKSNLMTGCNGFPFSRMKRAE